MNPDEHIDPWHARPHLQEDVRDGAPQEVVEALRQLHATPVPASFAAQLEQRMRERARALQHEERTSRKRPSLVPPPTLRSWAVPLRRTIVSTAALVLVLVVVGVTLVNASAQSLPGDWLYGLKQWRNQMALSQAQTPTAKAQIALQQLQGAVGDLRAEVRDQRGDSDVLAALTVLATETHTAQEATNAVTAAPDRTKVQMALANEIATEETTLYQVAQQGDWAIRLACTVQLRTLSVPVLVITAVLVTKQQGTITLSIQGTHFASGVQVVIDGQPVGMPTMATATSLSIQIPVSQWGGQDHEVGIQNPDGTATELLVENTPADHGKGHATPTPNATPIHGHHGLTPTPVHGHQGGG